VRSSDAIFAFCPRSNRERSREYCLRLAKSNGSRFGVRQPESEHTPELRHENVVTITGSPKWFSNKNVIHRVVDAIWSFRSPRAKHRHSNEVSKRRYGRSRFRNASIRQRVESALHRLSFLSVFLRVFGFFHASYNDLNGRILQRARGSTSIGASDATAYLRGSVPTVERNPRECMRRLLFCSSENCSPIPSSR